MVKTATRLMTPVSEIESATSPPASLVRRLAVTPPGQKARIIMPTASSGGSRKRTASA